MPELRSDALRRIVSHELARGNTIRARETAWSRMDLVVRFDQPIDAQFAAAEAAAAPSVRLFETHDPHYGGELGAVDGRESVTGPAQSMRGA